MSITVGVFGVNESVPCVNEPPLKVPLVKEPPLNLEVFIVVGVFAVNESSPCVNEPPLNDPCVNEPPLNLDTSIAVGVLDVQPVILFAEILFPRTGRLPAFQPLALPTDVVVNVIVASEDWFAVKTVSAVAVFFCNFNAPLFTVGISTAVPTSVICPVLFTLNGYKA